MLDKILLAIAQAEQSRLPVDGIVVNDLDWRQMQALKDAEDRYLGNGPFGPVLNLLWQVPVVATPSMPQDEFLVGSFRLAAMLFDRMDPALFISDSHDDYFIKNMLAVLAEERVALTIKRPTAFVTGDFGNVT
jgi:HK97 family phage major capsid protein